MVAIESHCHELTLCSDPYVYDFLAKFTEYNICKEVKKKQNYTVYQEKLIENWKMNHEIN